MLVWFDEFVSSHGSFISTEFPDLVSDIGLVLIKSFCDNSFISFIRRKLATNSYSLITRYYIHVILVMMRNVFNIYIVNIAFLFIFVR